MGHHGRFRHPGDDGAPGLGRARDPERTRRLAPTAWHHPSLPAALLGRRAGRRRPLPAMAAGRASGHRRQHRAARERLSPDLRSDDRCRGGLLHGERGRCRPVQSVHALRGRARRCGLFLRQLREPDARHQGAEADGRHRSRYLHRGIYRRSLGRHSRRWQFRARFLVGVGSFKEGLLRRRPGRRASIGGGGRSSGAGGIGKGHTTLPTTWLS